MDIRPGQVLEVTAHAEPLGQRLGDDPHVVIERLAPGPPEFEEYMVVGAGGQDPGLAQARVPHQAEVLTLGPNPSGDLRVPVPPGQHLSHRLTVAHAVQEELTLPDHPVGSAQPVEQVEQLGDLRDLERRPSLLAVAERRVGDDNLAGGVESNVNAVEQHFGRAVVRELLPHQVRLGDIDNVNEPSRMSKRPAVLHDGPPRRLDPGETERTIGSRLAQYSGHFNGGLEPSGHQTVEERYWDRRSRGGAVAWPESSRLPSSTAPAEGISRMPSVWRKKSSRQRSRKSHPSG